MGVVLKRRRLPLDRAQALDLSERRPVLLSQRLLAVTAAFERKAVLARAYQRNERPREPAALSGLCGRGESEQRTSDARQPRSGGRPSTGRRRDPDIVQPVLPRRSPN